MSSASYYTASLVPQGDTSEAVDCGSVEHHLSAADGVAPRHTPYVGPTSQAFCLVYDMSRPAANTARFRPAGGYKLNHSNDPSGTEPTDSTDDASVPAVLGSVLGAITASNDGKSLVFRPVQPAPSCSAPAEAIRILTRPIARKIVSIHEVDLSTPLANAAGKDNGSIRDFLLKRCEAAKAMLTGLSRSSDRKPGHKAGRSESLENDAEARSAALRGLVSRLEALLHGRHYLAADAVGNVYLYLGVMIAASQESHLIAPQLIVSSKDTSIGLISHARSYKEYLLALLGMACHRDGAGHIDVPPSFLQQAEGALVRLHDQQQAQLALVSSASAGDAEALTLLSAHWTGDGWVGITGLARPAPLGAKHNASTTMLSPLALDQPLAIAREGCHDLRIISLKSFIDQSDLAALVDRLTRHHTDYDPLVVLGNVAVTISTPHAPRSLALLQNDGNALLAVAAASTVLLYDVNICLDAEHNDSGAVLVAPTNPNACSGLHHYAISSEEQLVTLFHQTAAEGKSLAAKRRQHWNGCRHGVVTNFSRPLGSHMTLTTTITIPQPRLPPDALAASDASTGTPLIYHLPTTPASVLSFINDVWSVQALLLRSDDGAIRRTLLIVALADRSVVVHGVPAYRGWTVTGTPPAAPKAVPEALIAGIEACDSGEIKSSEGKEGEQVAAPVEAPQHDRSPEELRAMVRRLAHLMPSATPRYDSSLLIPLSGRWSGNGKDAVSYPPALLDPLPRLDCFNNVLKYDAVGCSVVYSAAPNPNARCHLVVSGIDTEVRCLPITGDYLVARDSTAEGEQRRRGGKAAANKGAANSESIAAVGEQATAGDSNTNAVNSFRGRIASAVHGAEKWHGVWHSLCLCDRQGPVFAAAGLSCSMDLYLLV